MATTNENVITVEVSKRTPKKKTAVMERLENSPRKALTPEILKSRQLAADERRQSIENQKAAKAHQHLEHVKSTNRKLRMEKENSPASSPVKGN